jgi:6-phosphofructokinase 1
VAAIDAATDGRWGTMSALRGQRIDLVPLAEAVDELRTVPPEEYDAASAFFG